MLKYKEIEIICLNAYKGDYLLKREFLKPTNSGWNIPFNTFPYYRELFPPGQLAGIDIPFPHQVLRQNDIHCGTG